MAKVAVTGGDGFIGSNLTRRLISDGYDVVIVHNLSTGLISNVVQEKTEFDQISITESKALSAELKECETIFYLAARESVPHSIKNPVATHDVYAAGTLIVLEAVRTSGAHIISS